MNPYNFKSIPFLYLATFLHASSTFLAQPWSLKVLTARWARKDIIYLDDDGSPFSVHNHFMSLALREAEQAGKMGEVPIGALVVQQKSECEYEILSRAGNRIETSHDASAHAELLALRKASARVKNWRLANTTLYCTLEPCPMCLSACQAFRVQALVYGAPDLRLGAVETHLRLLDIKHPFHNISIVVQGVQADSSASLLRSFFKRRREERRTQMGAKKHTWY